MDTVVAATTALQGRNDSSSNQTPSTYLVVEITEQAGGTDVSKTLKVNDLVTSEDIRRFRKQLPRMCCKIAGSDVTQVDVYFKRRHQSSPDVTPTPGSSKTDFEERVKMCLSTRQPLKVNFKVRTREQATDAVNAESKEPAANSNDVAEASSSSSSPSTNQLPQDPSSSNSVAAVENPTPMAVADDSSNAPGIQQSILDKLESIEQGLQNLSAQAATAKEQQEVPLEARAPSKADGPPNESLDISSPPTGIQKMLNDFLQAYNKLTNEDAAVPQEPARLAPTPPEALIKHPSILCDFCDQRVFGVRYACLDCPDFDLCSDCYEQNGRQAHIAIHEGEHVFVALHKPKDIAHLRSVVQPRNSTIRHPGIICDACEDHVVGTRYKCVSCEDYDECQECFTLRDDKSHYKGHLFVAIPNPVASRKARDSSLQARAQMSKQLDSESDEEADKGPSSPPSGLVKTPQDQSRAAVSVQWVSEPVSPACELTFEERTTLSQDILSLGREAPQLLCKLFEGTAALSTMPESSSTSSATSMLTMDLITRQQYEQVRALIADHKVKSTESSATDWTNTTTNGEGLLPDRTPVDDQEADKEPLDYDCKFTGPVYDMMVTNTGLKAWNSEDLSLQRTHSGPSWVQPPEASLLVNSTSPIIQPGESMRVWVDGVVSDENPQQSRVPDVAAFRLVLGSVQGRPGRRIGPQLLVLPTSSTVATEKPVDPVGSSVSGSSFLTMPPAPEVLVADQEAAYDGETGPTSPCFYPVSVGDENESLQSPSWPSNGSSVERDPFDDAELISDDEDGFEVIDVRSDEESVV